MLHSLGKHLCLRNTFVFQKFRYKHQNAHRTIAVKLLQDIPGVGERSSIQSVAPGRMRHVFYPRKQAEYITEGPRKSSSPKSPQATKEELLGIRDRLSSLKLLVFRRATREPPHMSILAESHKLKGPVTNHDVIRRLGKYIDMDLTLLNVNVVFQDSATVDRVDSTGEYSVFVHLSTGDIFSINVRIEPKLDAIESQTTS